MTDWFKALKVDFSTGHGRSNVDGDKKRKKRGLIARNPHSSKGKKQRGPTPQPKPTGEIPQEKCDSWPACRNDAEHFCYVCGMKACAECYEYFDGHHPKSPHPMSEYSEHWEEMGAGQRKAKKEDKYTNLKDWDD